MKNNFAFSFITITLITVAAYEDCDKCVHKDKCSVFGTMTRVAQDAWQAKYPCSDSYNNEQSPVFGFDPVAKGDYVCCSNGIWSKTERSDEYKSNGGYNSDPYNSNEQNPSDGYTANSQPINYFNENNNPYVTPNPYFPTNSHGRNNNNNQCPVTITPPSLESGCCGVEASDPDRIIGHRSRRNPPAFPRTVRSNNNGYYNWAPKSSTTQSSQSLNPRNWLSKISGLGVGSNRVARSVDDDGHKSGVGVRITGHQPLPNPPASPITIPNNDHGYYYNWAPNPSTNHSSPYYNPSDWSGYGLGSYNVAHSVEDDKHKPGVGTRIIGGKATEFYQFPWTVLLMITFDYGDRKESFNCGGSLISSRYVLTAGHCVYDKGGTVVDLDVYLSEYDKRTFPWDCKMVVDEGKKCIKNIVIKAESVTLHPRYEDAQLKNDIALIKLKDNAPYTDYIRPICLPSIDIDTPKFSNLRLAVAGWGRNGRYRSDIKQSTVVQLVPQEKCMKFYPGISRRTLCAAGYTGEDTCKGDSGGPLMTLYGGKYEVVGVVSGKRADSRCGTSVPSLYTNVYHYRDWILANIKN